MPYDEGVIKYDLEFELADAPNSADIEDIMNWRTLLHQMDLIGQDDNRYGGFGYGNISCRIPKAGDEFIVTGTQTGHLHQLTCEHFCRVTQCDVSENRLVAKGPVKPSSEAITHGAIYQFAAGVNVVIHVHCPEIWQCREALRLPQSGVDTGYGTPQLASEIKQLFNEDGFDKNQLLVIPGHRDGVITFGETAEHAGHEIIRVLASAIQNFK